MGRPGLRRGPHEHMLAIESELGDRFANVVERTMAIALGGRFEVRKPATGELFDGRNVDQTIVEKMLQTGHVSDEKATVLPDRVAAQGRGTGFGVRLHE